MDLSLKRCGQCGEYLPHSDFNKNKSRYDGLDTFCRTCRREYNEKYRKANQSYYKKYYNDRKHNYIYLIMEGKQIMYVGSTVNDLSYRISNHINYHSSSSIRNYMKRNTWTSIKYIPIDEDITEKELRAIEQIFIDEMCPILNQATASTFENMSEDSIEFITELAYEYLDYYEEYAKTYKINYSNIEG